MEKRPPALQQELCSRAPSGGRVQGKRTCSREAAAMGALESGNFAKREMLVQWVWTRPETALLTSFQGMPIWLVHGPHFG